MATFQVTAKQKSGKAGEWVEGSYKLPNSTTAKLTRKDGSTKFPNSATLKATAKRVASAFGWELDYVQPVKKAAKKSVRRTTKKKDAPAPAETPSNSCTGS